MTVLTGRRGFAGVGQNFGRLVTQNLKIFVYPLLLSNGELVTAANLRLPGRTQSLYDFMYKVSTHPDPCCAGEPPLSCNTTVLHAQPPRCTAVSFTPQRLDHPPEHLPRALNGWVGEARQSGNIVTIDEYNLDIMKATRGRPASYVAIKMIREGNPDWENMVTPPVRKVIKEQGLFGYKASATAL